MSNRDRFAVFPSRANHVLLKQRTASALKGLNLLKRKRDALELRLREISVELRHTQRDLGRVMHEALFSMAKARYLCTDFKPATVMDVDRADIFLTIELKKVVGVMLPVFKLTIRPTSSFPLTGLANGGVQVEVIRSKFQEATKLLIEIASLQFSTKVLLESVRQNNTRVNGLEFVVIPRIINTVNYIRDELDEFEREDFYRLKRSQAKQRQAKEKFTEMVRGKAGENEPKYIPTVVAVPFDERNFEGLEPVESSPPDNSEANRQEQSPEIVELMKPPELFRAHSEMDTESNAND